MGEALYAANPDCRIYYYRGRPCNLEPLLPTRPIQSGDIILFARFGKTYILHRVVQVFPDGTLELLGDAQVNSERVHPDHVRAIVTSARHGEALIDEKSLRWQFFRGPWRHLRRSRPYLNRIRSLFKE